MSDASGIGFESPSEYYSDSVRFAISPYGFRLEFGLQTDSPGEAQTRAIVRMSPQHAFVFCQLMRKNLVEYQDKIGPISLPEEMLRDLGIGGDL